MIGRAIVSRFWEWLKAFAVGADGWGRLLEILGRQYAEEVCDGREFRAQMQRLEHPQFAEQMTKIIASEEKHVRWLREKILELGGDIPQVPNGTAGGRNMWEIFSKDVSNERRSIADLEEAALAAYRIDPQVAEGLRRMREDEEHHRELITDMLMRSDPQAHLSR